MRTSFALRSPIGIALGGNARLVLLALGQEEAVLRVLPSTLSRKILEPCRKTSTLHIQTSGNGDIVVDSIQT